MLHQTGAPTVTLTASHASLVVSTSVVMRWEITAARHAVLRVLKQTEVYGEPEADVTLIAGECFLKRA
ncbi:uncharacterized protein CTRU02_209583 [Colletotrichum truncatum]|uniref:Uncharacterized protein n=1 Tax=Colletotrichum truncatum TaxID=5467 RepID=A0ACC3YT01_COLTU|nr:uncharacterized protein CTRU02_14509 [Colletotrichum truncatum]KAF6782179.1 hypothetical protein CTRU02_14509 [Colletotrichum truncatum]